MTDRKSLAEATRAMVELLRAAADLVEDGTIVDWGVDQEFGIDNRPDPAFGGYAMRAVHNGSHKVTITLNVSRLSRERLENWLASPKDTIGT